MAELPQCRHHIFAHLFNIEGAKHGDEPVLRCPKFARAVAPCFREIDERRRHRTQITARIAKYTGDAIHGGRGRLVADKVRHEFCCKESRCRWMADQCANHTLTFLEASVGVSDTEHGFRSRLMEQLPEYEADRTLIGL